jgi:hypothetical protein
LRLTRGPAAAKEIARIAAPPDLSRWPFIAQALQSTLSHPAAIPARPG